jgi:hypothetical protein
MFTMFSHYVEDFEKKLYSPCTLHSALITSTSNIIVFPLKLLPAPLSCTKET